MIAHDFFFSQSLSISATRILRTNALVPEPINTPTLFKSNRKSLTAQILCFILAQYENIK
jgi:hypothetical protein